MASARKKLDEKNLKTLRELLSHPSNKHCFDCNQRGPTYVNVAIGSFVCTTCSGMLRGLTPPHRVKSITMATFTQEEIDFISARGNQYCKKVWLGLYDGHNMPTSAVGAKDEQALKDYMASVYERKRYYVNPSDVERVNGTAKEIKHASFKLPTPIVNPPATVFSSSNNNNNNNLRNSKNNNLTVTSTPSLPKAPSSSDPFGSLGFIPTENSSSQPLDNFANFDNNPVFAHSSPGINQDIVDIRLDTQTELSSVVFNPWGTGYQEQDAFQSSQNSFSCWGASDCLTSSASPLKSDISSLSSHFSRKMSSFDKVPPPPSEDRYAALKDLDSFMKSQLSSSEQPAPSPVPATDWGQPTWTPNFDDIPRMQENSFFEKPSNPFSSTTENGWIGASPFGGNPFKTETNWPTGNGTVQNGLSVSQSLNFNQIKSPWDFSNQQMPNPFTVNGTGQPPNHHSSNPFL